MFEFFLYDLSTKPGEPHGSCTLQWGRRPKTTESGNALHPATVGHQPSMGPPSEDDDLPPVSWTPK
jgi:hypothetical protein